jgi:ribosomal protein L35
MNAVIGLRGLGGLFRGTMLARPMTVPTICWARCEWPLLLHAVCSMCVVQTPSPFDIFGEQCRALKTYKLKTHKGAAKRLFPVGSGRGNFTVKHERAGKQHLVRFDGLPSKLKCHFVLCASGVQNTKMSGALKQDSSHRAYVHKADMPNVRRMLPYGTKFNK